MDASGHDPSEVMDSQIGTNKLDLLAIDDLRSDLIDILDARLAPVPSMSWFRRLRSN